MNNNNNNAIVIITIIRTRTRRGRCTSSAATTALIKSYKVCRGGGRARVQFCPSVVRVCVWRRGLRKVCVLTIMGRESKCVLLGGRMVYGLSELIESPAPCATARPADDAAVRSYSLCDCPPATGVGGTGGSGDGGGGGGVRAREHGVADGRGAGDRNAGAAERYERRTERKRYRPPPPPAGPKHATRAYPPVYTLRCTCTRAARISSAARASPRSGREPSRRRPSDSRVTTAAATTATFPRAAAGSPTFDGDQKD